MNSPPIKYHCSRNADSVLSFMMRWRGEGWAMELLQTFNVGEETYWEVLLVKKE